MKHLVLFLFLAPLFACDKHTESKPMLNPIVRDTFPHLVGGGCEGCELYLVGMPAKLQWQTDMASADEPGEQLTIAGFVYKKDGITPAANVIIYFYQTDNTGLYSPAPGQNAALRHGHLRGWVKTGSDGRYSIRTIKPVPYPDANIPRHIHPTIKEPGLNEYYIDDIEFDDDPLLIPAERARRPKRGGTGIVSLTKNTDGSWSGQRNIVLGLNIPGYPE